MKKTVRLMSWFTLISCTLLIGSQKSDAKTAYIERQGDRVHVTYKYGDSYQLQRAARPDRNVVRLRHEHVYYVPFNNCSGIHGVGPCYNGYSYPFYIR